MVFLCIYVSTICVMLAFYLRFNIFITKYCTLPRILHFNIFTVLLRDERQNDWISMMVVDQSMSPFLPTFEKFSQLFTYFSHQSIFNLKTPPEAPWYMLVWRTENIVNLGTLENHLSEQLVPASKERIFWCTWKWKHRLWWLCGCSNKRLVN